MKQLGPHRKYVILAIVLQSLAVILIGYYIFKARATKEEQESHGESGKMMKTVFLPPSPELLDRVRLIG